MSDESPEDELLARYKQAVPLISQRERIVTEVLSLIRQSADSPWPARFVPKISRLRAEVALLSSQIKDLLPFEDEMIS